MSSEVYYRSWMDKPHLDPNTNLLTEEYVQGIGEFMRLVQQQPDAKSGMLRCPCSSCNNNKVIKEFDVWTHLYMKGFSRNYKVWYLHGETGYEYDSTKLYNYEIAYGPPTTFRRNSDGCKAVRRNSVGIVQSQTAIQRSYIFVGNGHMVRRNSVG
uniref:Transposase-associated domain-containing protein n=1 Tax=Brassica oleracea var. oleracea TaxID=109376 RepID=A0A0D3EDL9_BRAOL